MTIYNDLKVAIGDARGRFLVAPGQSHGWFFERFDTPVRVELAAPFDGHMPALADGRTIRRAGLSGSHPACGCRVSVAKLVPLIPADA